MCTTVIEARKHCVKILPDPGRKGLIQAINSLGNKTLYLKNGITQRFEHYSPSGVNLYYVCTLITITVSPGLPLSPNCKAKFTAKLHLPSNVSIVSVQ